MTRLMVYLDWYPFDFRKHNTEWSNAGNQIPKMVERAADIEFQKQKSSAVVLQANYEAARSAAWRCFNERYASMVVASKCADMFNAMAAGKYKNGAGL